MNGLIGQVGPLLLIFAVFYFFIIRPQQKRQKDRVSMLGAIKKDDKVVTIGGLHGKVVDIDDNTVTLLVNETTMLTFERHAVNTVKND
jgi:preprotein translocase subunit YajC